jgi:hypothetical protein
MSTSGSTDYSTTRLDIINRALSLLGVVPQGGTPTTYDLSDANLALNGLVKSWMADGLQLWAITSYNIPLTNGVNKYRIGLNQTINISKPLKIQQAYNRNTTSFVDIPMRILTRQEYNMLGNKSVSGNPIQIYYDPQRVYGDLYVFPTPTTVEASNNIVVIHYQRPFEDFDADIDEPDFPQEWFDAICYGLACRLAPSYGIPLADRKQLWNEMTIIKQDAMNFGLEEGSMFFQRDFRNW